MGRASGGEPPERRRILVVPSLQSRVPGLGEALASVDLLVEVSPTFTAYLGPRPTVLAINIWGFGAPEDWGRELAAAIADKERSRLLGIPTLILDPDQDWDRVGWASGYEGRLLWPTSGSRLREMIDRIAPS